MGYLCVPRRVGKARKNGRIHGDFAVVADSKRDLNLGDVVESDGAGHLRLSVKLNASIGGAQIDVGSKLTGVFRAKVFLGSGIYSLGHYKANSYGSGQCLLGSH